MAQLCFLLQNIMGATEVLFRAEGSSSSTGERSASKFAAKSLQLCPQWPQGPYGLLPSRLPLRQGTLHGTLQARTLEWVAIPSARGSSQSRDPTRVPMSPVLTGGFFTTRATWEARLQVYSVQFSSVQSLSRVQFFVTPRTAAHQASLSFTNSQDLLMSLQSVMPSNRFILCRPLLLLPSIFPSNRVFSNESALYIRWSKYWSFVFSDSLSNEHLELISFKIDWLDLLAVQGILKSLLQHHS